MNFKETFKKEFLFFIGAPALVWQLIFFYLPLLFLFIISFSSLSLNYFIPFFSSTYLKIIIKTLLLAYSTVILCFLLAYPLAHWMAFHSRRWRSIFIFLLFVPFWTNFLLHVYAWMFVMERNGVVNVFLMKLGLISEPVHFLNSTFAIMLVMVYCYLPFMALPIYSSLEKFDLRLYEMSHDLGATWWQTLKRVVLPVIFPGIRSGIFLVFIPACGEFVIPELMGGDKSMFVGSVISHYTLSTQTVPMGVAFTLITVLLVLVASYVTYKGVERFFMGHKG